MSSAPLHIAAISLHTSPLAVPGSADAGGMNVVVLEEARALARLGHRVDLVTRRTGDEEPAVEEVSEGIRLVRLDAGPAAPLAKSEMEQAIAPFRTALSAHLAGMDRPWDVIHAHHWFSGVAALQVARDARIPLVQSFHSVAAPEGSSSLVAGEPAESSGRIAGERRAARESDLVVAVSDAEALTVRERYDVRPDRLAVVRPGVDTAEFSPRPDGAEPSDAAPVILFAARLQPLKAPDLAIEVLARLGADPAPRLVLAGAASDDFAEYPGELRALARDLGVEDRVEFRGPVSREDLATAMREASVLLLPSWSETFGLVALESQASGTPVIAWRCAGGVAEAIGDGGIVLESRDPDVWAHATETVLTDAARRGRMVRAARDFAEHRTWDISATELVGVYRRVLDRPEQTRPEASA